MLPMRPGSTLTHSNALVERTVQILGRKTARTVGWYDVPLPPPHLNPCRAASITLRRDFATSHCRRDHYATLALSPSASQAQIKSAFIKLSKQYHPDLNHAQDAKAQFQKVGEAYQVLGNDRRRRDYDRDRGTGRRRSAGSATGRTTTTTAPTSQPWDFGPFGTSTNRGQAGQAAWTYRRTTGANSSSSAGDYWTSPRYRRRETAFDGTLHSKRSRSPNASTPGGFGSFGQDLGRSTMSREDQLQSESVIWKAVQVLTIVGVVVFISGGFRASADAERELEAQQSTTREPTERTSGLRIDPVTGRPCRICNSLAQMQQFQRKATARPKSEASETPALEPETTPEPETAPDAPAERHDCPLDREELGRNTWAFLHTTASYFPLEPSTTESMALLSLLRALPHIYPCPDCAAALAEEMGQRPPEPAVRRGRSGIEAYLCSLHNEVNARLGKDLFDCATVGTRWRDGPSDGRCD